MAIRTTKRLVELDGETWKFLEIDVVKLKRVAKDFKAWLLTVDPNNDPFGFLQKDLPFVEAALNGAMMLPFRGDRPHGWELTEGLLSRDYSKISAPFYNTIRGSHLAPPKIIEKNGKRYAWAEFELPEDDAA